MTYVKPPSLSFMEILITHTIFIHSWLTRISRILKFFFNSRLSDRGTNCPKCHLEWTKMTIDCIPLAIILPIVILDKLNLLKNHLINLLISFWLWLQHLDPYQICHVIWHFFLRQLSWYWELDVSARDHKMAIKNASQAYKSTKIHYNQANLYTQHKKFLDTYI